MTRGQESVVATKYGSVSELAERIDFYLSTGRPGKDLDLL